MPSFKPEIGLSSSLLGSGRLTAIGKLERQTRN
jgi:hypothetical protein